MTTRSITPTIGISTSQLRDDIHETLTANGFTPQDVERLQRQLAYRKGYNLRPEVRERRRVYTTSRNAKMKALKNLLSQM